MSNNRVIIGSVPGLRFFLHRLNPGPGVAVQKQTTRYPPGAKKKLKNLPGSLNSARV